MLLAKSVQPCTLTALSLTAGVLLFACIYEAAAASFGSGDTWNYSGEAAETPLRGKFCTYVDSRLACAQGHGSVGTDGGEFYEGNFVNGEPDGSGRYESDLLVYVGSFKRGRFDGAGELTCWQGNRKFKGTFKDGAFIGALDGSMQVEKNPWRAVFSVILWPEDAARWLEMCR